MKTRRNSGMVEGLAGRLLLVAVCVAGAMALGCSWPLPLAFASVLVFVAS